MTVVSPVISGTASVGEGTQSRGQVQAAQACQVFKDFSRVITQRGGALSPSVVLFGHVSSGVCDSILLFPVVDKKLFCL